MNVEWYKQKKPPQVVLLDRCSGVVIPFDFSVSCDWSLLLESHGKTLFFFLLLFQGTSVLSPGLHIGLIITLAIVIYKKSTTHLFENHPCLYVLTFGFVSAKITQKLVVRNPVSC